jgi:carbonic anhydrase
MEDLNLLFEQNRSWAAARRAADPQFFDRLRGIQEPKYLWIGCSDSRVPANQIVGLEPGELFVHRNVGNIVVPGDPNCMAVVQYAVETLKVRQIIICGHYGCGGVLAALEPDGSSLPAHVERWLAPLRHLALEHSGELQSIGDREGRWRRLCERNVADQVRRLVSSDVVIDAHLRGLPVVVHGWIYDLRDGLLRDLAVSQSGSSPSKAAQAV